MAALMRALRADFLPGPVGALCMDCIHGPRTPGQPMDLLVSCSMPLYDSGQWLCAKTGAVVTAAIRSCESYVARPDARYTEPFFREHGPFKPGSTKPEDVARTLMLLKAGRAP